jgi:hypothetical protein
MQFADDFAADDDVDEADEADENALFSKPLPAAAQSSCLPPMLLKSALTKPLLQTHLPFFSSSASVQSSANDIFGIKAQARDAAASNIRKSKQ